MKTVHIFKGLPACGKTFICKTMIDKWPGKYKRVNKDDLRSMIDNKKWSKSNEQFIINIRNQIILKGLDHGCHLLIDDTNLHPKHEINIRQLIKKYNKDNNDNVQIEIIDLTGVSVETCLKRDRNRPNWVGEKIINKMYNQFLKVKEINTISYNKELRDCVICDLDGTLALLNGRNPYDASFCEQDIINIPVNNILNNLNKNTKIIFVSGREDKYKSQTVKWLNKHNFINNLLFMRKSGDTTNDSIIKENIYETHIKNKYNVLFVIDDRNKVVDMWRNLGLTCFQCTEGDF